MVCKSGTDGGFISEKWTPNILEVLWHCHICPSPHPRAHAPAVQEALEYLVSEGLIEHESNSLPVGGGYKTTERGQAHMEQILSLPLPVAKWVGHDGKIIDGETNE